MQSSLAVDSEKNCNIGKYLQFSTVCEWQDIRTADGNISPGHLYIACLFLYFFHWKCEKGRCDEKYIKLSVVCAPVWQRPIFICLIMNQLLSVFFIFLILKSRWANTKKNPLALKSIVPCRKKHTTILTYTTFQRIIIFDKK